MSHEWLNQDKESLIKRDIIIFIFISKVGGKEKFAVDHCHDKGKMGK